MQRWWQVPLRLALRVHAKLADLGGAAALDEASVRRTTDGAAADTPCREDIIRWSIPTSGIILRATSRRYAERVDRNHASYPQHRTTPAPGAESAPEHRTGGSLVRTGDYRDDGVVRRCRRAAGVNCSRWRGEGPEASRSCCGRQCPRWNSAYPRATRRAIAGPIAGCLTAWRQPDARNGAASSTRRTGIPTTVVDVL